MNFIKDTHIKIEQVKTFCNDQFHACYSNELFVQLENGWLSTSKETPERGMMFKPILSGEVVTFVSRYKEKITGVIEKYNYDGSVCVRGTQILGGIPILYGVSIKQLKSLNGKKVVLQIN